MEVSAQFSGLLKFLAYFIAGGILTALFLVLYIRVTPYKDFELISKGNIAAACSLSGTLIGFMIPLASAIIHSVDMVDMLVWGVIALLVQVLVFIIVRLIFKNISYSIEKGFVAEGIFLGAMSIAAGILNAACMSY
jgi:putative membrane protein